MARTSRIFLSGSVLVIDSLRVSIQFPYHYSNVRKSKKKEKPTRKTGDEGRSVAEAAANEPLGDHFPKVGSYAFLTEKRESRQLCGKPESTQAYDFSYSRLEDNTSIICSKRIMNEENHIMAFFGKLDFLWKVVES